MTKAWPLAFILSLAVIPALPALAQAPVPLGPQAAPAAAPTPSKPRPRPAARKPAQRPVASPELGFAPSDAGGLRDPASVGSVVAAAAAAASAPDLAYGAYQGGKYLAAFAIATRRANDNADPAAMALLGEIYANGFGIRRDDEKAAAWYSLAADRGDRAAAYSLAMFRLGARGGPRDVQAAVDLLTRAAKLGHAAAAYDLALLYLDGQQVPRDLGRAAELFRQSADAGNPDAQHALATLYKEGRGVTQDYAEALRLLAAAARAGNTDAEVEYAIALYNGGIGRANREAQKKDERSEEQRQRDQAAAGALFLRAAKKGSAIAQNRLAVMLATGRGLPANPIAAAKWHIIAKAGGDADLALDEFVYGLKPAEREAGEKAAKVWLSAAGAPRS
jgi:TPR repeat protein